MAPYEKHSTRMISDANEVCTVYIFISMLYLQETDKWLKHVFQLMLALRTKVAYDHNGTFLNHYYSVLFRILWLVTAFYTLP